MALSDLLYELETGDRRSGHLYRQQRSAPPSQRPKIPEKIPSKFDADAEAAAAVWENVQIRLWRKAGRLTTDGVLRVTQEPGKPYTLRDLARIWQHLGEFDALAALIELDGVVKGGYMNNKEHENIRKVIEQIADARVAVRLQDGDTAIVVRDLIRVEVAAIFGELLLRVGAPISTLTVGGRQLKCSKCRQPGHRATTCGRVKTSPPDITESLPA